MKSILDPSFRYTASFNADVQKWILVEIPTRDTSSAAKEQRSKPRTALLQAEDLLVAEIAEQRQP